MNSHFQDIKWLSYIITQEHINEYFCNLFILAPTFPFAYHNIKIKAWYEELVYYQM